MLVKNPSHDAACSNVNDKGKATCQYTGEDDDTEEKRECFKWNIVLLVTWMMAVCSAIFLGLYLEIWLTEHGGADIISNRKILACILAIAGCITVVWVFFTTRFIVVRRHNIIFVTLILLFLTICYLSHVDFRIFIAPSIFLIIACYAISSCASYKHEKLPSADVDELGFRLFYERMEETVRKLNGTNQNKGITIAVSGRWGTGKSFFIGEIEKRLSRGYRNRARIESYNSETIYDGEFRARRIDVWRSTSYQMLCKDIACALAEILLTTCEQPKSKIPKWIVAIFKIFNNNAASAVEDIDASISSCLEDMEGFWTKLQFAAKNTETRALLIIDNLDRCNTKKLYAIFALIEKLKTIPKLTTLCGVSIGNYAHKNRLKNQYFEGAILKVFDIIVPIPTLTAEAYVSYSDKVKERIAGEFPHLCEWLKKTRIRFQTPRDYKKVVDNLSIIEKAYLDWFDDQESNELREYSYTIKDAIFLSAALRTLFPIVSDYLEIQIDKGINDIKDDDTCRDWLKGQIDKKFHDDYEENVTLNDIVEELSKADMKSFVYAIKQKFLRINYLSYKTCDMLIEAVVHGSNIVSPLKVIRNYLSDAYYPNEEENIYVSVFARACGNVGKTTNYQYIQLCIENDLKKSASEMYRAFFNPILCYHVISACYLYLSEENNHSSQDNWLELCKSLIQSIDLKILIRIINAIIYHLNHGVSEFSEVRNALSSYLDSVHGNRELKLEMNHSEILQSVLNFLFTEYGRRGAQMVCNENLREFSEIRFWEIKNISFILNSIRKGVNEYLLHLSDRDNFPPHDHFLHYLICSFNEPVDTLFSNFVPIRDCCAMAIYCELFARFPSEVSLATEDNQRIEQMLNYLNRSLEQEDPTSHIRAVPQTQSVKLSSLISSLQERLQVFFCSNSR